MSKSKSYLDSQVDEIVEKIRQILRNKIEKFLNIRKPSEMLNLEQELQGIGGRLISLITGAVLSAIHLDLDFVRSCQKEALEAGLRNERWCDVQIQTLGGVKVSINTPYAVRKRKKVGRRPKGRGTGGSGEYPVLRRLGIVCRSTPTLLAVVNREVLANSSEAEVKQQLAERAIVLDKKTIRRFVRDFGGIALWQRQTAVANLSSLSPLRSQPLANKRVVMAIDGGRLRIRTNKKGRRRATGRHGFYTDWREPKVVVIYTIDALGRKEKKGVLLYDGTLEPADYCFKIVALHLKRLGIRQANSLTILADGAPWIWKRIDGLVNVLKIEHLPVVEIIDWAHACAKVANAAKVSSLTLSQQKAWIKKMKKQLKKGKINKIIESLSVLYDSHDTEVEIRRALNYCQTHSARMQYAEFEAQGLPIGSGAVESAIRRIINLRLKGPGIFWYKGNAERVLHLRCQLKAGLWLDFVNSVLHNWANDMSISLAQVNNEV